MKSQSSLAFYILYLTNTHVTVATGRSVHSSTIYHLCCLRYHIFILARTFWQQHHEMLMLKRIKNLHGRFVPSLYCNRKSVNQLDQQFSDADLLPSAKLVHAQFFNHIFDLSFTCARSVIFYSRTLSFHASDSTKLADAAPLNPSRIDLITRDASPLHRFAIIRTGIHTTDEGRTKTFNDRTEPD